MSILPEAQKYFFDEPDNVYPIYLERNDFVMIGLSLQEELGRMFSKSEIDADVMQEVMKTKTLWSARIHFEDETFKIVYAATFAEAVNGLYKEINS